MSLFQGSAHTPPPRGQGKVQQPQSSHDGEVPPLLCHGSLDTRLRSWLYGGIFLQLWDGLMTRADQKALSVWHAVGAPECSRFAGGSTAVVPVGLPK